MTSTGMGPISPTLSDGEIEFRSELDISSSVADARSMQQIREQLKALDARRREAEQLGDEAQRVKCNEDLEQLERYLSGVERAGGGARVFSTASEKARKAVSKAIRIALNKVEREHPILARHLDSSIKRGRNFTYISDASIMWEL